jgi:hypothetical protein
MRKLLFVSLFLLTLVLLMGCGGSAPPAANTTPTPPPPQNLNLPDWFINIPQDPNFLFSAKSDQSMKMQTAIDKAVLAARQDIATQVDVRITSLQKKFEEETGFGKDAQMLSQYTSAAKAVAQTSLSGSKERKKDVRQNPDGTWTAFVLVEYPVGAAQEAMRDQIRKNEQMYTRFRATQTYNDMDQEAAKYEQYKKEKGQQ